MNTGKRAESRCRYLAREVAPPKKGGTYNILPKAAIFLRNKKLKIILELSASTGANQTF